MFYCSGRDLQVSECLILNDICPLSWSDTFNFFVLIENNQTSTQGDTRFGSESWINFSDNVWARRPPLQRISSHRKPTVANPLTFYYRRRRSSDAAANLG